VAPISKGKPLVLLQVNYKSIYNKTLYFWNIIYTYNPEVVTGMESWLSEEISNAEVVRADNTTFRRERHPSCGGMFV
jgi:predicted phosphohydrolase